MVYHSIGFIFRYDLLLNGGGSQTIVFQKAAYRQTSSTIAIGWNDFITVDVMKMFRETEAARSRVDFILPSTADASACDLFKIPFRPKFFPFWRLFPSGGLGSGPVLYYDARVLQQSFNVSGSDLRLNHFSSRANGFASLMLISLTDEATTSDLARITVRVSIAGLQEETIYDASPNLSHTFAWNGSNSYKQQVFGFSNAKGVFLAMWENGRWEKKGFVLQLASDMKEETAGTSFGSIRL